MPPLTTQIAPLHKMVRLITPLLERHSDLELIGGKLVLKPVGHFKREISVLTLRGDEILGGFWQIHLLFSLYAIAEVDGQVVISERMSAEERRGRLEQLGEERASLLYCEECEATTLPFLRSIRTLAQVSDLLDQQTERGAVYQPETRFWLDVALGRFDAARTILERYRAHWQRPNKEFWEDYEADEDLRRMTLCHLLDRDAFAEIALLLRDWEMAAAAQWGLWDVWKPQVFPFEQRVRGLAEIPLDE